MRQELALVGASLTCLFEFRNKVIILLHKTNGELPIFRVSEVPRWRADFREGREELCAAMCSLVWQNFRRAAKNVRGAMDF